MLAERPHTIHLPEFGKVVKPSLIQASPNPKVIAQQWISKFESVLSSNDVPRLKSVMHNDCWWRDMLAFEWDFHTIQGLEKLTEYVGKNQKNAQLSKFRLHQSGKFAPCLLKPIDGLEWIESMFDFESKTGRGSGMMRIVQGSDGIWKGYMMYTVLKEFKGFEERVGYHRAHGGNNSLVGGAVKGNWQERRQRQLEFLDEEPQVLIVGAGKFVSSSQMVHRAHCNSGQSGLNVGARLQALGMSCLIIDKNSRIGDNWRHRYRVSQEYLLVGSLLTQIDTRHWSPTIRYSIHTWHTCRFHQAGHCLLRKTRSATGSKHMLAYSSSTSG